MLTLENVTDDLESLYADFKTLSAEVYETVSSLGDPRTLKPDVDLLGMDDAGAVVFIREGYFRLIYGNKVVRLYSEGDFIGSMQKIEGASLTSEFSADVTVFNLAETIAYFGRDAALLKNWFTLMDMENRINLGLCAHLVDERVHPSLELKQFQDGETIVKEGTNSEEIYEMITGHGVVMLQGTELGVVETGEIFGEMSALIDCPHTADVVAEGPCCVRVVKKEDFFKLIEVDRYLSATIAKTLAKRITDLNRRLLEK